MAEDLTVSRALPGLSALRSAVLENKLGSAAAKDALDFVTAANRVLGCIAVEEELLPADIEALIERRQAARKSKDFKESDRIRDLLLAQGIALEDTPKGVVWRRK
jgi:cysteinyl-tRNA synthetase